MVKLLLVTAQWAYVRGRDTQGLPVRHEAGLNYYELAEQPLSRAQQDALAAAGNGFRRGVVLSLTQLPVLNLLPTPLAAAVVEQAVNLTLNDERGTMNAGSADDSHPEGGSAVTAVAGDDTHPEGGSAVAAVAGDDTQPEGGSAGADGTETEAVYAAWAALPYKELQAIAAEHEIPAVGVKKHDLITALMELNAARREAETPKR